MSAATEAGDIGLVAGARVYARMTLMRLRRRRVLLWGSLALFLLPLVYVTVLALLGHWGRGLFDDINELVFRFLLPFMPALFASSLVAEEIENKTFTFVFARPAPRASLIAGKYVAALAPLVIVLVPTLLVTWLIALARFPGDMIESWPHLVRVELAAVLGLCGFGALALALGTVFSRHPIVAVLGYLGLIELGLSAVPVVLNRLTLTWHLRNLAELPLPATEFAALDVPAWGSAIIAAGVTPLLLWLASLSVNGAEYRTDR
jgi:ABC-type transport system involved in multi-copper enzyme maturation permease subunit